jgi:hypothetical protein
MTDPLEDTQALSAEEVAELTGEAEEQDETGAPEKVAETEHLVPSSPRINWETELRNRSCPKKRRRLQRALTRL